MFAVVCCRNISFKVICRENMQLVSRKKNREDESTRMAIPRVTMASIESLSIPLVHEVVFLADYRCTKCQQRVVEVMSKMNGEMKSILISVLEKKVTLTCEYSKQEASICRNPFNTFANFFLSFCT